jgi:hypothetical protein
MIATLSFDPPRDGIRRARFVPRPTLPVDAACVVANGIREALRTLVGDACAVTIGEPVALDAAAWRLLTHDALLFATPGRATDVVFVLAMRDARCLVRAAFGEDVPPEDGSWSTLEAGAIERIVARCAHACDALCVERRGPTSVVDAGRIPRSVAYFDVRIAEPLALTIGVGILRELSEAPPARVLSPGTLAEVGIDVRVILGRGTITAPGLLGLQVGTVVPLGTKVASEGELNLAGQRIAFGTCGVRNSHSAFEVRYPS